MKRLFAYIVSLMLFFNAAAAAALPELPADFQGEVTRARLQKLEQQGSYDASMGEIGLVLWEIGRYFYEKHPDIADIDDKILLTELRPFFPQDDEATLESRLTLLRNAVTAYRAGNDFYTTQIKERLAPHPYKTVHSDLDYDHPDEVPYIAMPDGEYAKVYNFKKFLTYGSNDDEKKAISEYERAHKPNAAFLDKIDYALQKLEWRKLPFYGKYYKNPLLSELGVAPLTEGRNVQIRLLSRQTYIDEHKQLDCGLHIITDDTHFVLANDIDDDMQKIRLDFSGSENVENVEVLYPAPFNAKSLPMYHKYFGDFMLPLQVTVANPQKPVTLRLQATLTTCGTTEICFQQTLPSELTIAPTGPDIFDNGYDNFFAQSINNIPKSQLDELQLVKFVVDDDNGGQTLRLEFSTPEDIKSFRVYVEEIDDITLFDAPLISILDNHIYARLPQLTPQNHDLNNSQFRITAVLNDRYYYRDIKIARPASEFDPDTPHLNCGLILLAVLGGLLLNFMPCVFPVLSLKIMSLSLAGDERAEIRRSLWQTVGGIFTGFTLIIGALLAAKAAGLSLGWGMQFQNMSFLVVMTFGLIVFIVAAPRLQNLLQNGLLSSRRRQRTNFATGVLIVLLSTPCTGPYLATAIGFALTGTYADIIILLYAVAIGLSLPYWLVLTLKQPEEFFPRPGAWMDKLSWLMRLMLALTIGWFLLLIYQQTDLACLLKLGGLLLLFLYLYWIYGRFTDYLDEQIANTIPSETMLKIRARAPYVILLIFAVFVTVSAYIAHRNYTQNYAQNMQTRTTLIDTALIGEKLNEGRSVLVEISADWCLTCQYNSRTTLTKRNLEYWQQKYKLDLMRVDWTNYNAATLAFMERYGRKGLPFYILYTPFMREGMVLSEIFSPHDLENMLIFSK